MIIPASRTATEFSRRWAGAARVSFPFAIPSLKKVCANPGCGKQSMRFNLLMGADEGFSTNSGWLCSLKCFEASLAAEFADVRHAATLRKSPVLNLMPLGLILLARGVISHDQLRSAIARQKRTRAPLGHCLRTLSSVSEQDIASAIGQQWATPTLPNAVSSLALMELLPMRLEEEYRAIPVHWNRKTGTMLFGFAGGIEHKLLMATERMLNCRTQPCIITDSCFEESIARRNGSAANEVTIDTVLTPEELAQTVGSYARQLRASDIQFSGCGEYLWVRVSSSRTSMQLLFRNNRSEKSEETKKRSSKPNARLCR